MFNVIPLTSLLFTYFLYLVQPKSEPNDDEASTEGDKELTGMMLRILKYNGGTLD